MLQHLEKKNVTMLPGLFRERMLVNRNYLLELGTQELLQNYYLEAGIVMPDLQILERPETAKLRKLQSFTGDGRLLPVSSAAIS